MKAHAPATPEDAVIRFDQLGEGIPARLIESRNRVPRPRHQLSLARQDIAARDDDHGLMRERRGVRESSEMSLGGSSIQPIG
jgi:hypothetical protein